MLIDSGLKEELMYINDNTPKNKNIIYFIITFIVSFLYFFNVYFIAVIHFVYYLLVLIINILMEKDKKIYIECKNDYENSLLFFYKEMVFNFAKSKAFLCYYNFIKIIYKKKEEKTNVKLLIFSYLFKRIFKFVTFIPFTVFKINCIIYKRSKNIINKDYKNSSLKAIIDHILLNIYLEKISDDITHISNYKIIIEKKTIKFNPPKADKNIFKNSYEFFIKKKDIEKNSEFALFKNKKEKNGFIYRHICKRFNIFLEDFKYLKYPLFTETKSDKIVDKYGNEIKGKLKDSGSKTENIKTNRIGPFIIENNNNTVLEPLRGSDIKIIKEAKNKVSWQLVQEMFYNEEVLYLDDDNIIFKKKGETLRDFYKRNYNNLNDESKRYLDAKEKFDSENDNIIKNMSSSEYEKALKSDFDRWNSSFSDYNSDFNEKYSYKDGKNKNNFTSDSEYDD